MPFRTPIISYNLNERGRDYTGQDRAIDIDAAMRLINSPATQEAVRKGDFNGYLGHGFREKYGLAVPETVTEGGKTVALEPACKTVLLKCLPDGTLQHQQEFMDTASGRVGARIYQSGNWGFSSVFHAPEVNGKRTPLRYYGMDFVRSPNYDTNRGYATMLDSTEPGAMSASGFAQDYADMLDSVSQALAESDARAASSEAHSVAISESYLHQCQVNEELADRCARLEEKLKAHGAAGSMLDSVTPEKLERGSVYTRSRAAEMLDSADRFMSAALPTDEPAAKPEEDKTTGIIARGQALVAQALGLRR
ncbi:MULTISPECIES: hypothetical protein [Pseudomonas]|uniref:hypothetical protein n=1 Tax=Pseudomonas TaxID=286 RepID=UPI0007615584|nr:MULTISPECIES: hypothetical protein [Pseudomonas]MDG9809441.1 hypothetical protein [Pseudomonas juntendi]MDG9815798.1 hypothetical protein [Pseudomonas putida]